MERTLHLGAKEHIFSAGTSTYELLLSKSLNFSVCKLIYKTEIEIKIHISWFVKVFVNYYIGKSFGNHNEL